MVALLQLMVCMEFAGLYRLVQMSLPFPPKCQCLVYPGLPYRWRRRAESHTLLSKVWRVSHGLWRSFYRLSRRSLAGWLNLQCLSTILSSYDETTRLDLERKFVVECRIDGTGWISSWEGSFLNPCLSTVNLVDLCGAQCLTSGDWCLQGYELLVLMLL